MLNHWLEWDKWVLTNFVHDRQWFNTLIPPSHESAAVTVDCISGLSGPVRLILRYTTVDVHCRDRRYEWGGGISVIPMPTYIRPTLLYTDIVMIVTIIRYLRKPWNRHYLRRLRSSRGSWRYSEEFQPRRKWTVSRRQRLEMTTRRGCHVAVNCWCMVGDLCWSTETPQPTPASVLPSVDATKLTITTI